MKRCQKKNVNRQGFTLPEVMVALTVSMILATFMAVCMVDNYKMWRDATAEWQLMQQSRLVREKMLKRYNLRELKQSSLTVAGETPQLQYAVDDGAGSNQFLQLAFDAQQLIGSVAEDDSFGSLVDTLLHREVIEYTNGYFVVSNRLIICVLDAKITLGGKEFTHKQTLRTSIINL